MYEIDGIAGLSAVDHVLMLSRSAEALVIRRTDDIAVVDESLQSGHPEVDLLCGIRIQVGDEVARWVGLGRRGCRIAEAGGAVAPSHHFAVLAFFFRGNDHATGFVEDTVHILRNVADFPCARALDVRADLSVREQVARVPAGERRGKALLGRGRRGRLVVVDGDLALREGDGGEGADDGQEGEFMGYRIEGYEL